MAEHGTVCLGRTQGHMKAELSNSGKSSTGPPVTCLSVLACLGVLVSGTAFALVVYLLALLRTSVVLLRFPQYGAFCSAVTLLRAVLSLLTGHDAHARAVPVDGGR